MTAFWGPAFDAEVAYRHEQVRAQFGRRPRPRLFRRTAPAARTSRTAPTAQTAPARMVAPRTTPPVTPTAVAQQVRVAGDPGGAPGTTAPVGRRAA